MAGSAFENKPIDGNMILRQIAAEKAQQEPGSGVIRDHPTGQVLASAFGSPAAAMPRKPIIPDRAAMQDEAYDEIDRDMIYAKEMAEGGDNSAMMLANGATQDYVNGEMPMEAFTPEELKKTQTDYLNQAGKFSNFAENNGMDMNELFNRFSDEYTDDDLAMFKDARKIKNFDDAVKVGMMNDEMADFMDLDTEKFFGEEGIMEKCGEGCQERRRLKAAERKLGKNPMAANDKEFMRMNDMLGE